MSNTFETLPETTLSQAFRRHAIDRCDQPALWDEDGQRFVAWGTLFGQAWCLGRRLSQLARQDAEVPAAVCHAVGNRGEDVVVALACLLAGMIEMPVDASGGEPYIDACRRRAGAFWLDESAKRELVRQARRDVADRCPPAAERVSLTARRPGDDALVLWTSGTSGKPKGVVLSERALSLNAWAKLQAVPQSSGDLRLTLLSIAHAYARTCDLGTWLLSGCRLAIDRGYEGWLRWASRLRPNLCNTVPSFAERMLTAGQVPDSLRLLGCGGAAMPADLFAAWRDRGVVVIQGYGLTEAGPVIASQTPKDSLPGHAGRIVGGWQHRIDRGRLWVRGRHRMNGYLRDPVATAARIDPDGWLDTGDLVERDDETDQLRILGRADDRIVLSNGHVVDPLAIETRLARIPGIVTAVVAKADDGRGVEWWLEPGPSSAALPPLEDLVETLPAWERPRCVRSFQVSPSQRRSVFNRKGALRREPMMRLLRRSDSFRDHA